MARSITFGTVATGTLEDRGLVDDVWIRIALSSPPAGTPHIAVEVYLGAVLVIPEAYTAMWQSIWDP